MLQLNHGLCLGCFLGAWLQCVAADTVLWWPFAGTVGEAANQVTNAVSPGTATGVATNVLGGALPTFASAVPATNIWDGINGGLFNADNRSSLLFTGNGATGGVVCVADDPAVTRPVSVTVEAFIKGTNFSKCSTIVCKNQGSGVSWSFYVTNSTQLGLRIDTAAGGAGAVALATTGSNLKDGNWHHVAFSYIASETNAILYVDYVLKTSKKLTTPPLLYDGSDVLIGHNGGGDSFDGWIDEVRITNKALGNHQLLRAQDTRIALGGTLLYYTFDSLNPGSNVGTVTNQASDAYLNGTAAKTGTGSVLPQFASDRPDVGTYSIRDGKGGATLHSNLSSVKFRGPATSVGGTVSAPWPSALVPPTNLTVEAFVKPDWPLSFAGIFRKARDSVSSPTFALSVTTNGAAIGLTARFDTNLSGSSMGNETIAVSPSASLNLHDGRWHHVALTYNHPEKRARVFVDYTEVGTRTTANPLVYETGDFVIGTSGNSYYDGWIDEVRVTGRVLTTNEFLRVAPSSGTMVKVY